MLIWAGATRELPISAGPQIDRKNLQIIGRCRAQGPEGEWRDSENSETSRPTSGCEAKPIPRRTGAGGGILFCCFVGKLTSSAVRPFVRLSSRLAVQLASPIGRLGGLDAGRFRSPDIQMSAGPSKPEVGARRTCSGWTTACSRVGARRLRPWGRLGAKTLWPQDLRRPIWKATRGPIRARCRSPVSGPMLRAGPIRAQSVDRLVRRPFARSGSLAPRPTRARQLKPRSRPPSDWSGQRATRSVADNWPLEKQTNRARRRPSISSDRSRRLAPLFLSLFCPVCLCLCR